MGSIHIVRQGECLSSIADYYHLSSWHRIYDDPHNADFRKKRPNPNLIYPGDELYIPDLGEHIEHGSTDKVNRYRLKGGPTYLNVCIQDLAKQPLKNVRYRLVFADQPPIEGTTDGSGWIKKQIPPQTELGTLQLWPNPQDPETTLTWQVKLGHLDPLDTTSGVKGRLQNLGYYDGAVDDQEDAAYTAAVQQFQTDNGLQADGVVTPETRNKLREEHRI